MTVICPFCFEKVDLNKTSYLCSSSTCVESGTINRHVIKKPKVDKKGYCTCDQCGRTTTKAICSNPKCQAILPDSIRESETKIISIVGAAGCGKSYFVATLLRQIMENGLLARINGAAAKFCSGSREEYEKRYRSNMDSRTPLPATKYVTDIIKDNPPILTQLTYTNSKRKKIDNTYSFFDAAGESFHRSEDLSAITNYIAHSEAIILILDPRQIPKVNAAVTAAMPKLPPVTTVTYTEIINNVVEVVRNSLRLSPKRKIDIPLCVAFSKWDLLMNTPDLLNDDLLVSQPSQITSTGFDINLINTSSAEIRALLNEWEANFVASVEQQFKEVCYFGFSAWGPASKDGMEVPAIASFRVEDPMLWIMNRNKLL